MTMAAPRAVDVAERLSDAMHDWAGHGGVKFIQACVRRGPSTIKAWLRGESAPDAASLVELCRESDAVFEEFCRLCGRADAAELDAARKVLGELEDILVKRKQ